MAEHLLQQTLSPEMAVMADYYEQGVTPPTAAAAAYSRYSRLMVDGQLPGGDALDELVKGEAVRIGESALAPDGAALDAGELQLRSRGLDRRRPRDTRARDRESRAHGGLVR